MMFEVLRQHYGDKQYFKGDEREAEPGDVQPLVDKNVLRAAGEKAGKPAPSNKAAPKPANKAEKPAPANKTAG